MTDQEQQQLTAAGNEMSASFLAAKKRSDATLAKLEAEPGKFTMLSSNHADSRNCMEVTIKLLIVTENFMVKSFQLFIKEIQSVNQLF